MIKKISALTMSLMIATAFLLWTIHANSDWTNTNNEENITSESTIISTDTWSETDASLESQVNEMIRTYYNELKNLYDNWEITKEKLIERLRVRILILKEQYWDQLANEFYESKMKIADNIWEASDSNISNYWNIQDLDKTQDNSEKQELDTIEDEQAINYDNLTDDEFNILTNHKSQINNLLATLKKAFITKSKEKQIEKLQNIINKINKKIIIIKAMKNAKQKKNLLLILRFLKWKLHVQIKALS